MIYNIYNIIIYTKFPLLEHAVSISCLCLMLEVPSNVHLQPKRNKKTAVTLKKFKQI